MSTVFIICLLWSIAACVQLYYWSWSVRSNRQPRGQRNDCGVSVVVCVHHDVDKLKVLLQRLRTQNYPVYEIVIVNDGPNTEIKAFLNAYEVDNRLHIVHFDSTTKVSPGKKAPLTAGIQAANYNWLLLTDVDCTPGSEWIAGMMRHVEGEVKMVIGYAPLFSRRGVLNSFQRFDNVVTATLYLGAAIRRKPYMGVGRNLLYHRSLFTQVHGFEKHAHLASGDDDLFVQEVATPGNTAVCLDPATFVYSEAPVSLADWIHQKRRHLSASRLYSISARIQNTAFASSWLILWIVLPVVLMNGSFWHVAGIIATLVFWMVFARITFILRQHALIPWYPLLAAGYCLLLCTFAGLLILHPPKTWMKS